MKIGFLADIFADDHLGGGELNDAVLIDFLQKNFNITKYYCRKINFDSLKQQDAYIVSNFVTLPLNVRDWITTQKYIIYEHDHKYVKTRDASRFKNFNIPQDQIMHGDFYKKAEKIFVLSQVCKDILEKNNISKNVHNIGCSLWRDETLDYISNINKTVKKHNFGVVSSQNPIKGFAKALQYCRTENIEPHLIKSNNYKEFLRQLSECKNLIFFPQVLETFSRLAAEAKMLNCNLITNPKMLGFASEPYVHLKGDELIKKIACQKNNALKLFEEWCSGE
jgi:hypothetical protein